jgi:hypothetical protein
MPSIRIIGSRSDSGFRACAAFPFLTSLIA